MNRGPAINSRNVAGEEARLLRMASENPPSSHDSRNAWLRVVDAKEAGTSCGLCGRPLAPDETLWRTRVRISHGQHLSTNLCRECVPEDKRAPEHFDFEGRSYVLYEPEPCEVCGRPVVWLHYPHWRRYRCCSWRCDRRNYNRARNEASAHAREKVCEVCGVGFTAKRRDAKTCSPACRQKGYRQRVATPTH